MCREICTDMVASGMQVELVDVHGPELWHLVESMPSMLVHSETDSTAAKFDNAFQRWKFWAQACREVNCFGW